MKIKNILILITLTSLLSFVYTLTEEEKTIIKKLDLPTKESIIKTKYYLDALTHLSKNKIVKPSYIKEMKEKLIQNLKKKKILKKYHNSQTSKTKKSIH